MLIETGSRFVMTGDSVTDCGRAQPLGERPFGGLGTGYPALVDSLLAISYPERKIRATNTGVSGNTSKDLLERWESDVLALAPGGWASAMIGINDVWRRLDSVCMADAHVSAEQYAANIAKMAQSAHGAGIRLLLLSPVFIESRRDDEMRKMADECAAACKEAARKHSGTAIYVDVQSDFDAYLRSRNSNDLSWDRVHPNQTGHMIIARAILKAIEYDWELG
ncbi:MAG: SGNH/GDSL hydrolase family protein [Clostridiales bacterium]|jgi:lysophospholipase L1-like esterase|nr:SGNH/GDSL hydrolase family protein [Clostridiales bacterium]